MPKALMLAAAAIAIVALSYAKNHAEEKEPAVNPAETTASDKPDPKATDAKKTDAKKTAAANDPDAPGVDPEKIDWSKVDWRKRLNRKEFAILRLADTERAFSGEYWDFFEDGAYKCRGCGLPLFASDSKFDSECGWPSFDRALNDKAVVQVEDRSHGMSRIEIRCRRCDGHLGHIFNDGPTETGLRYCMNSASIKFVSAEEEEKAAAEAAKAAEATKAAEAKKADEDKPVAKTAANPK
jgi:peptide-methionine (R)-S-oxide reductase